MGGSDKKKLKAALKKTFPLLTDDQLNELLPMKDEIVLSKIFTFTEESVLLYIHNKNTVFFEMEKEKQIFPSVYTLWKVPDFFPTLTTMPAVMPRIANGADLMLPGVIINDEKGIKAYCDGKLNKGDQIAINLLTNKAPIAVGTAWLSSEDMYMAARKGKAVNIKHFYGDQLWAAGTREQLPDLGPPEIDIGGKNEEEDIGDFGETADEQCMNEIEESTIIELEENIENLHISESEKEPEPESEEDNRSPQEKMDDLLNSSLLQCLKTSFSAKKSEFPILTSNFYRLHVVPSCPPDHQLDIKKSSFKKLSKFLENKEKVGLLKVKELSKGVESITSVDYEHELIRGHRVLKFKKEVEEVAVGETNVCDKSYEPPVIVELFAVTANVLKLFKTADIAKGTGLTVQQIRQILTNYVKTNELKGDAGGFVKLDAVLKEISSCKGEQVAWEELQQNILSKMSPAYSLKFGDTPAQIYKGKLEPVELTVATRSGNKKVTLINNLDTYKIDPSEFAHKCQLYLSVGTSYHPAPNRKSGTEVLIQGNHIPYAAKLLFEEYKIPKKYVKGCDNIKSKKKK